jgi:predicted membrane-bound mannosyltransferase/sugar lactone lactonase YvrE
MDKKFFSQPIFASVPWLTWEVFFFGVILALATLTRFLMLGNRAMSHDESLHTYYSWRYSQGFGYQHNPMMHGPFQFHILAAVYYFLGSSDFTSRMPAALFSIATIWMAWYWRRYIGKIGALLVAIMLLISPYMLYYGRYARNEAFVGLYAIVMLYVVLRYLETGWTRYLYLLVLTIVFHLITKETSYIYIGELLLFLTGYLVIKILSRRWENHSAYQSFIVSLGAGILLVGSSAGLALLARNQSPAAAATAIPSNPAIANQIASQGFSLTLPIILGGLGIVAFGFSLYFLLTGFGLSRLRAERSFDMLILAGTLILPTLSAPLIKLTGGHPLDYSYLGIQHSARFFIPMIIVSALVGLWWNKKVWAYSALIFWAFFIPLYTSMFTYGTGFFSGLIGSLGYWLEQQPVQRGSQPLYYYLLIQIPMYEFLPAAGSLIALYYGFRRKPKENSSDPIPDTEANNYGNTFGLLSFWTIASLIAFTFAGERMPWLTYHIALPMILLGGWGIAQLIEKIDWQGLRSRHALIATVAMLIFLLSTMGMLYILLGANPPLQGKSLGQLESTKTFLLTLVGVIASVAALWYLFKSWTLPNILRLGLLTFTGILCALTITASFRASFWTYDQGTEYLVYAHGASGIKAMLKEIEDLSYRTTGSAKNIEVAYDDSAAWPITWYLRDFPNQRYYGDKPGPEIGQVPVIIVGQNNYNQMAPIVRDGYYEQEFIRMVWPNMDYFNLNFDRMKNALTNKDVRQGLLDIWLYRNYSTYAQAIAANDQNINPAGYLPASWNPSEKMRLYIQKSLASQMWEYGSSPMSEIPPDPYEAGKIDLTADLVAGASGADPGLLNAPRGLAVAPDGTIYVADSRNNRVQRFAPDGKFLGGWGSFKDRTQGEAPMGTFNEPWGIAVAKDGSVFVSDTWNHRIQKFTSDGKPVMVWGSFGQSTDEYGFYGPRGLAFDPQGRLYVADTGNNRIAIYDQSGKFITSFGTPGTESGQFSEPVDVFIDANGLTYVTDTWNQRIQVFSPNADFTEFTPVASWNVAGWFGGSNENKPFITVNQAGHVFITDPEGYRVVEFDGTPGGFVRAWGTYGTDNNQFNLPTGLAVDSQGHLWVSDSGNNRLLRFTIPQN